MHYVQRLPKSWLSLGPLRALACRGFPGPTAAARSLTRAADVSAVVTDLTCKDGATAVAVVDLRPDDRASEVPEQSDRGRLVPPVRHRLGGIGGNGLHGLIDHHRKLLPTPGSLVMTCVRTVAFAVALTALVVPQAGAACRVWSASGTWAISQGSGLNVVFRLTQSRGVGPNADVLSGTASYTHFGTTQMTHVNGAVSGWVSSSGIQMIVRWSNGPIGVYEGRINGSGSAVGSTYDQRNAASNAPWHARQRLACAG